MVGDEGGRRGAVGRLAGIDVLFLCTGNTCRSPMAEAMLRDRLAARGVDVHVHSAGLVLEGEPAAAYGVEVLGGDGIDLSRHRSRIMTRGMLENADLLLGMAREHVREAAVNVADCWARAFTLKEFVRRAEQVGARQPGQPFDEWVAKVHAGRDPAELLGRSHDDDIADPIGRPRQAYEQTAREIRALVDRLVELAWGRA